MPDSMIVVETRTSASPARKACMRSSSSFSDICPCATRKRSAGHSSSSFCARLVDRLDAVVEVERLPAARMLALERRLDQLVVVLADRRPDRAPAARRRLDDRDVAKARERHVERPRNRRRGEREHVDLEPQRAQQLLLRDAEPLLLVEDDEPEVLRDDVPREDPVRPDEDVDLPLAGSRRGSAVWSARLRKRETISTRTGSRDTARGRCSSAAPRGSSSGRGRASGGR